MRGEAGVALAPLPLKSDENPEHQRAHQVGGDRQRTGHSET
jgi:hypothetical protein